MKSDTAKCKICGQKHAPIFHKWSRRNLYQHTDKMAVMSSAALLRYLNWFYSRGLTVADLIRLQNMGVAL